MLCVIHAEITLGFEKDVYVFDEVIGDKSVDVVLRGQLERDVTVLVSTIPGTATGMP